MPDPFTATGADAPTRVFCFPYAGGNPRRFLGWQQSLAGDAEIVAVTIQGRGADLDTVIEGAAEAIRESIRDDHRPVYLLGHSLGALIAFEVARRLTDASEVHHLVASGISAPSLLPSRRVRQLAALEGTAFAEELAFFGGLPPELLADQEVLDLLLPQVIADGRDDPHVGIAQLEPWRRECKNPPTCHWADGGHFYLEDRPAFVIDLVRELVRADNHVELI